MTWISQPEIEMRIRKARLQTAPNRCPTCNATTGAVSRRCCLCNVVKPLEAFVYHRGKPYGRDYRCKPCHTKATKLQKLRAALRRSV
jgi:hypothetical protein